MSEELDASALRSVLSQGAKVRVLDVRSPEEYAAGHVTGAENVPLDKLDGLPLGVDDDIIVYCQRGPRALQAQGLLQGRGKRVRVFLPGYEAWHPLADGMRYARQETLPEIGAAGQARLAQAHVAVVGAGGLGSPALLYLAGAGVGTLTIIDADVVDETNLHRQVLHTTHDIGRSKVDSGLEHLRALNPLVQVHPQRVRLVEANAQDLLAGVTLVVDGSDNLSTRYAVCAASVRLGIAVVHASVHRFLGQLTSFVPDGSPLGAPGPCYACLFPRRPGPADAPNCAEVGVLGAVPGVLGSMQAALALKLLLGIGDALVGRMLHVDLMQMTFRSFETPRDPACTVCGAGARLAAT